MRRSLSLKRETLSPLTSDELSAVAGGSHLCLTDNVTHGPSIDESCNTLPVYQCLSINPGCSVFCTN